MLAICYQFWSNIYCCIWKLQHNSWTVTPHHALRIATEVQNKHPNWKKLQCQNCEECGIDCIMHWKQTVALCLRKNKHGENQWVLVFSVGQTLLFYRLCQRVWVDAKTNEHIMMIMNIEVNIWMTNTYDDITYMGKHSGCQNIFRNVQHVSVHM